MKLMSLSSICGIVFLCYILHSTYTLYMLFRAPQCTDTPCYQSQLTKGKFLQLSLYTSPLANPTNGNKVTKLGTVNPFDPFIELEKTYTIKLPKETRSNGTLYMFAVLTKGAKSLEWDTVRSQSTSVIKKFGLTHYMVPKTATINLLNDKGATKRPNKSVNQKRIAHIRQNVFIHIITEPFSISPRDVPAELARDIRITPDNLVMPIIRNDFAKEKLADLVEIDPKVTEASVTVHYAPSSVGKIKMLAQIERAMSDLTRLGFSEKDIDEVKSIFSDTNVYLLCGTIIISSVHLLIDFLSFKNDILFWKHKRHYAGLSLRSTLWRTFSHIIIFLYLLDEETSLLILIPTGIGTLIEVWKAKKILKLDVSLRRGIRFRSDENESDVPSDIKTQENNTLELDKQAMQYLSYILYPLCVAGAIYSLLYLPHKSWYSWTISSMANGVYAFGFLFMLPQLFINYKLKSVAALPWRVFMYKSFNTFIDDVFAFIITMPTAHRFACFRDDVVFLVYLYQRWLYPVDKTRIDEDERALMGKEQDAVDEQEENTAKPKKLVDAKESKKDN
ncbi:cleft lip and palate transmembrane protein 1-like protein [Anopheles stephensi]|uniref:Lipid scramblase CLPTM1L n=1 Tax=Anopheles stephensi TaxID=30069 RepID=A0A182YB90_ANOST|nr:cleft lip and palate transmembrane protein 1-like protein [Anopheles stephensi]